MKIHEMPKVAGPKPEPQPLQVETVSESHPPPEILMQLAMDEPNRRLLDEQRGTIAVLRDEKGFTFREIAEWLTDKGIECDYNAVYRVYTKGMHPGEVAQLDEVTNQEEREG